MKKYIVVILIVFVGGTLLIWPYIKPDSNVINDDSEKPTLFDFKENLQMKLGDTETLSLTAQSDEVIKTELFYGDSILHVWEGNQSALSFEFKTVEFGIGTRKIRTVTHFSDGSNKSDTRFLRIVSDIVPERMIAVVNASYPHNLESFTQGLEFYKGELFESTGLLGKSWVAEIDVQSGDQNENRRYGLDATHFGEGITILNDIIYQLTWQNNKCITYDLGDNIVPRGEFYYPGEGWGLCNNGKELIMSDGSERITFRDPENFTTVRTIEVYDTLGPIINLNELEYIDGLIYANIWQTTDVVVIDPTNGKVIKRIDCSGLASTGKGPSGKELNGIAIDRNTGKIYMTGKNWSRLMEVKFTLKADA